MDPIVETKKITKTYGLVRALSDVSLSIPPGATGLLGPNGAGKSTLIRTLIGLVQATSGTGTIFNHDISTDGLAIRQRIGYMPEHECLMQDMSAVEMVAYAGVVSGMPQNDAMQRAHEVLHFMGIRDERYREIGTYSTGMKQKVNLAQSLVHDPDLLFLDEPTNGLDPKGRDEMMELIGFLAKEKGKSIILSSHILPDVEAVCEHIVVLAAGEVLMQGNLKEQLLGSSGIVNVRVMGNSPDFIRRIRDLGYGVEDLGGGVMKIGVHRTGEGNDQSVIDADLFRVVIQAASESGVQLRYASKSVMNLEDLFIDIVEKKGSQIGSTGGGGV
jgi:ABC-2 type transport system ATP-binding protein